MNIFIENILRDKFKSEEIAHQTLVGIWYADGKIKCPHCGYDGKIYRMSSGNYRCGLRKCHLIFSIQYGTFLQRNRVPLKIFLEYLFIYIKENGKSSTLALMHYFNISSETSFNLSLKYDEILQKLEIANKKTTDIFYESILLMRDIKKYDNSEKLYPNILISLSKENATNIVIKIIKNYINYGTRNFYYWTDTFESPQGIISEMYIIMSERGDNFTDYYSIEYIKKMVSCALQRCYRLWLTQNPHVIHRKKAYGKRWKQGARQQMKKYYLKQLLSASKKTKHIIGTFDEKEAIVNKKNTLKAYREKAGTFTNNEEFYLQYL